MFEGQNEFCLNYTHFRTSTGTTVLQTNTQCFCLAVCMHYEKTDFVKL